MSVPPPLPHEQSLYLCKEGTTVGPFSSLEINQMLQCGDVTLDTLVWKEGLVEWQPLNYLHTKPVSKNNNLSFAGNIVGGALLIGFSIYFVNVFLNGTWNNSKHTYGLVMLLYCMCLALKDLITYFNKRG
jgi:hypothetical protein